MNALEKAVKDLLENGYTIEEIKKTLEEMTKELNNPIIVKTDDK